MKSLRLLRRTLAASAALLALVGYAFLDGSSTIDTAIASCRLLRLVNPLSSKPESPKSIAFLFLTGKKGIAHEELWEDWLKEGLIKDELGLTKATVYVHTEPMEPGASSAGGYKVQTSSSGLSTSLPLGEFFCSNTIPSVPTKWLYLHHAMMQLLLYAYSNPHNSHFVFVSHNSIPIKTFDQVYRELVDDETSRMCLSSPSRAFASWSSIHKAARVSRREVVKGELWSTMSRSHVALALSQAHVMSKWNNLYERTKVRKGAPVEMFLPTLLMRHVKDELNECHGPVSDLNARPQWAKVAGGCCPTYTRWSGEGQEVLYKNLAPNFFSHECDARRNPCAYKRIREAEMRELIGAEGFMFLMKVEKGAVIVPSNGGNAWPIREALPVLLRGEDLPLVRYKQSYGAGDNRRDDHFQCTIRA